MLLDETDRTLWIFFTSLRRPAYHNVLVLPAGMQSALAYFTFEWTRVQTFSIGAVSVVAMASKEYCYLLL